MKHRFYYRTRDGKLHWRYYQIISVRGGFMICFNRSLV